MTGIFTQSPTGCRIWHDSGKKACTSCSKHLTSHSCSLASEVSSSKNSLLETQMFDIINTVTEHYGLSLNTVVLSSHRIHHLLVY